MAGGRFGKSDHIVDADIHGVIVVVAGRSMTPTRNAIARFTAKGAGEVFVVAGMMPMTVQRQVDVRSQVVPIRYHHPGTGMRVRQGRSLHEQRTDQQEARKISHIKHYSLPAGGGKSGHLPGTNGRARGIKARLRPAGTARRARSTSASEYWPIAWFSRC